MRSDPPPDTTTVLPKYFIVPTAGGPMQRVTNFGDRSTLITRQVAWSPDGGFIYAAVAETTTDVVLLDGLL